MILNNVTIITSGELIKRDIYFEEEIQYIKQGLSKDVDCTGLLLIPGLHNSHVHLASRAVSGSALGMKKYDYFDEIGFNIHKKRSDVDAYKASLLACVESLKEGVTHIDTMDYNPEPVIKALNKTMMSYTACLPLKDYHSEASDPDKQLRRTLELSNNYDNIILGLANEFECSPKLMRESLEFAREHDLPIHMHACETIEEVKHIKKLTGLRTIDYLNSIGMLEHDVRLAHCTYTDSKDILLLSQHDVPVLHCPTSNKAISDNTPPNKDMIRNKVRIQLGTDSFAWNPSASIMNEALKSCEYTGVSFEEAYNMTNKGLSEGDQASFSLIDLAPLKPFNNINELTAKIMNSRKIRSVYLKGREVIRDGKNLLGINEEKLIKDVNKIRAKLLE